MSPPDPPRDQPLTPAPDPTSPPATCRLLRDSTAVGWLGHGLLLMGRSGAGKSDLALRIVDAGGGLIADDVVRVSAHDGRLIAESHALPGHIEIRGQGIYILDQVGPGPLHLAVSLAHPDDPPSRERLPARATIGILGIDLPLIELDARAASALARLRLALTSTRIDA